MFARRREEQKRRVLEALMHHPEEPAEVVANCARVSYAAYHYALVQLENEGVVESRWEPEGHERPRRKLYWVVEE